MILDDDTLSLPDWANTVKLLHCIYVSTLGVHCTIVDILCCVSQSTLGVNLNYLLSDYRYIVTNQPVSTCQDWVSTGISMAISHTTESPKRTS